MKKSHSKACKKKPSAIAEGFFFVGSLYLNS